MTIQELPVQVANQIAAGEVVERPASVVKELVENAIDANATEIEIKVEESGLKSIQIVDNGIGMSAADAKLAFKRHATSKIFNSNDLFRIRTLGFRGEALPSIASVSEITLETSDGDTGTFMYLQAGELIDSHPSHLRVGSSVRVENIFYNTPARLKYLKSMPTEFSHVTDIIHREAIGHANIRFKFIHDDKVIFETNGKGRVKEVMAAIYNYKEVKDMIAINIANLDFEVNGFVSAPNITRSNKKHISIYLNGRYIKNFILNKAILNGYGSKLMVGRYPIAAVNIKLDPQLLDVNVHPTKQEVRISKEDDLYDLIKQAIVEALSPVQRIPEAIESAADYDVDNVYQQAVSDNFNQLEEKIEQTEFQFDNGRSEESEGQARIIRNNHHFHENQESYTELSTASHRDERIAVPSFISEKIETTDVGSYIETESETDIPQLHDKDVWQTVKKAKQLDKAESERNQSFPYLDYIGQMHGTYLLAANESGMYMIDQHAAQERIKYEYFRAIIADQGTAMQELLVPYVFEYTQAEFLQIKELLPKLVTMSIELEVFGAKSFMLNSHPIWMGKKDVQRIVEDMIELALEDTQASVAQYREATAIMMSCKRSIKANHYLNDLQAKQLLNDLAKTENPYNCPHGRPVLIHFSNYEIERMFKRIQDPHQSPQS